MGNRRQNFYNTLTRRLRFDDAAQRVPKLFPGSRARNAAAAVPRELINRTCLTDSFERIADRMHAYAEAGVTTLSVTPHSPTQVARVTALRQLSEALESEGLRS